MRKSKLICPNCKQRMYAQFSMAPVVNRYICNNKECIFVGIIRYIQEEKLK